MNPLKDLLQNGYTPNELDVIFKLEKIFDNNNDEKYIIDKDDTTIHIQNTYCFIILEKEASEIKLSFDVRLVPDVVANLTLQIAQAHPQLTIMESFMEDSDNNQLIFGKQKINEFLNFRTAA